MSHACTPFLVAVASSLLEIILSFKTTKSPFRGAWTIYSPWSSKNLIDRNRLKNFMQVGIDVTCMYANFGGCGFFAFGDITNFKNNQISLSGSMVIKKFNRLESAQKIHATRD